MINKYLRYVGYDVTLWLTDNLIPVFRRLFFHVPDPSYCKIVPNGMPGSFLDKLLQIKACSHDVVRPDKNNRCVVVALRP